MKSNKYFYLSLRRIFAFIILEILFVMLHNAVSVFLGIEEALFFILAVLVLPIYFIISIAYTLIFLYKNKKLRKDWYLGFLGFLGFQGLNGIMNRDWWIAVWVVWFVWFIYWKPVRK